MLVELLIIMFSLMSCT